MDRHLHLVLRSALAAVLVAIFSPSALAQLRDGNVIPSPTGSSQNITVALGAELLFGPNSATLTPQDLKNIQILAQWTEQWLTTAAGDKHLSIVGGGSGRGEQDLGVLSDRRARAVAMAFQQEGLPPDKMEALGALSDPADDSDEEKEGVYNATNRRVYVIALAEFSRPQPILYSAGDFYKLYRRYLEEIKMDPSASELEKLCRFVLFYNIVDDLHQPNNDHNSQATEDMRVALAGMQQYFEYLESNFDLYTDSGCDGLESKRLAEQCPSIWDGMPLRNYVKPTPLNSPLYAKMVDIADLDSVKGNKSLVYFSMALRLLGCEPG